MSRYDFLFNKYSKKLEKFYDETLFDQSGEHLSPETQTKNLFEKLWNLDPTNKKSRVDAILQWYTNSPIKDEDLYKVTENLKFFEEYKNKFTQKDLMSYKTYQDFFRSISPVLKEIQNNNSLSLSENQKEKLYKQEMLKQTEILEETKDYVLLTPLTQEASCYWGRGTQWCTAATSSNNYFEHYHSKGPLRIILEKKTPQNQNPTKYQFHLQESQFMDVTDEKISEEDIEKLYNLVQGKPNSILQRYFKYLSWKDTKDEENIFREYWPPLEDKDAVEFIRLENIQEINNIHPDLITKDILIKALQENVEFPKNCLKNFEKDEDINALLKEKYPDLFISLHQKNPDKRQEIFSILKKIPGFIASITPDLLTEEIIFIALQTFSSHCTIGGILKDYCKKTENIHPEILNALKEINPEYYIKNYGYSADIKQDAKKEYLKKILIKFQEGIKVSKEEEDIAKTIIQKDFLQSPFKIYPIYTINNKNSDSQKYGTSLPEDIISLLKEFQPEIYTKNLYSRVILNNSLENQHPFPEDTESEKYEDLCLKTENSLIPRLNDLSGSESLDFCERLLQKFPKEKTYQNFLMLLAIEEELKTSQGQHYKNPRKKEILENFLNLATDFIKAGYPQEKFNKNNTIYQDYKNDFPIFFKETQEELRNRLRTQKATQSDLHNPNIPLSVFKKISGDDPEIGQILTKNPYIQQTLRLFCKLSPEILNHQNNSKDFFKDIQNIFGNLPLSLIKEIYPDIKQNEELFIHLTPVFGQILEILSINKKIHKNSLKDLSVALEQWAPELGFSKKTQITQNDLAFLHTLKKDISEFYHSNPEKITNIFKKMVSKSYIHTDFSIEFFEKFYKTLSKDQKKSIKNSLFEEIDQTPNKEKGNPSFKEISEFFNILLEETNTLSNSDLIYQIQDFYQKTTQKQRQSLFNEFFEHRLKKDLDTLPFENCLKKIAYACSISKYKEEKDVFQKILQKNLPEDPEKIKKFVWSYALSVPEKAGEYTKRNFLIFLKTYFWTNLNDEQKTIIHFVLKSDQFTLEDQNSKTKTENPKKSPEKLLCLAPYIQSRQDLQFLINNIKFQNEEEEFEFLKKLSKNMSWDTIDKKSFSEAHGNQIINFLVIAKLYNTEPEKIPVPKNTRYIEEFLKNLFSKIDSENKIYKKRFFDILLEMYQNHLPEQYNSALREIFPNLNKEDKLFLEQHFFERILSKNEHSSIDFSSFRIPIDFTSIRKKFTDKKFCEKTTTEYLKSSDHEENFKKNNAVQKYVLERTKDFPFEILSVSPETLKDHFNTHSLSDPKTEFLNTRNSLSLENALKLYLKEIEFHATKTLFFAENDTFNNQQKYSKIGSIRLEERLDLVEITETLKSILQKKDQKETFTKEALEFLKKFPWTVEIKKYTEQDHTGKVYSVPYSVCQLDIMKKFHHHSNIHIRKKLLERAHAVPDQISLAEKLDPKLQIILRQISDQKQLKQKAER